MYLPVTTYRQGGNGVTASSASITFVCCLYLVQIIASWTHRLEFLFQPSLICFDLSSAYRLGAETWILTHTIACNNGIFYSSLSTLSLNCALLRHFLVAARFIPSRSVTLHDHISQWPKLIPLKRWISSDWWES